MIRGLAIYIVALSMLVSVYSAIAGITLDYALRVALLVELVAGATLAAAAIARRAGRQRWTPETRNDHNDRLPVPRASAEVVEPQVQVIRIERPAPKQIEAPRREVETVP